MEDKRTHASKQAISLKQKNNFYFDIISDSFYSSQTFRGNKACDV